MRILLDRTPLSPHAAFSVETSMPLPALPLSAASARKPFLDGHDRQSAKGTEQRPDQIVFRKRSVVCEVAEADTDHFQPPRLVRPSGRLTVRQIAGPSIPVLRHRVLDGRAHGLLFPGRRTCTSQCPCEFLPSGVRKSRAFFLKGSGFLLYARYRMFQRQYAFFTP